MQQVVGDKVKRAREARGWSQQELADRMQQVLADQTGDPVTAAYISQVERGHIALPGPDRFAAFERVLGVSRVELLRELGYLGPAESFDFITEARRVLQLPTPEEQEAALEAFPLEYLQILRAMVALASQLAFRGVGSSPRG